MANRSGQFRVRNSANAPANWGPRSAKWAWLEMVLPLFATTLLVVFHKPEYIPRIFVESATSPVTYGRSGCVLSMPLSLTLRMSLPLPTTLKAPSTLFTSFPTLPTLTTVVPWLLLMASVPAYNGYAHRVLMPPMDQQALAMIQQLEAEGRTEEPAYEQPSQRSDIGL